MPSASKPSNDSEKSKLIMGSEGGPLIRKNTVTSSTSRIGSSGKDAMGRKDRSNPLEYLKIAPDKKATLHMLSLQGS